LERVALHRRERAHARDHLRGQGALRGIDATRIEAEVREVDRDYDGTLAGLLADLEEDLGGHPISLSRLWRRSY